MFFRLKNTNSERIGEIMILSETTIYSIFPIIIAYYTKIFPPILFAGLSIFAGAISLFVYLLFKKEFWKIFDLETLKYSIAIALFIIIIPSILIFVGSSKTSGINTTILLQSEIIFTFIFFGLLKIETINFQKILGTIITFIGIMFIIYNGEFSVNFGDIFLILGTLVYPFGHYYAKKAIKIASPSVILFIRSFVGGIFLILISLIFETHVETVHKISSFWPIILFNGIVIYHISKIFWYEGIKIIDVSKAVPISLGAYPVFSLGFAIVLLGEIPNLYQIAGAIIIVFGIFILIRKTKLKKTAIEPVGAN
jgi:drug/metabolite transporter (DMT)-like permease